MGDCCNAPRERGRFYRIGLDLCIARRGGGGFQSIEITDGYTLAGTIAPVGPHYLLSEYGILIPRCPRTTNRPTRPGFRPRWTKSPSTGIAGGTWAAAAALLVAAGAGYWYWSGRGADAPPAPEGGRPDPSRATPVVAAARETPNRHLPQWARHGHAAQHRDRAACRRRADAGRVHRGTGSQAGRLARRDRSAAVPGAAAQAEGQLARDRRCSRTRRSTWGATARCLRRIRSPSSRSRRRRLWSSSSKARSHGPGQIANAKLQLTYARITAPIGGRLGLRQVDPGNIVRSGTERHRRDHPGAADQRRLHDSPGPVALGAEADGGRDQARHRGVGPRGQVKLATGTLLTADNQIDTTTGTVKLKAEFANSDASSSRTSSSTCGCSSRRAPRSRSPIAAIQRGAQGIFVYVVKEDQSVTLRRSSPARGGETTVIESGLAAGRARRDRWRRPAARRREGTGLPTSGRPRRARREHEARRRRGRT